MGRRRKGQTKATIEDYRSEEEIVEEAFFIRMEPGWPLWPILPVKNLLTDEHRDRLGILVSGDLTTVYRMTMFDLKSGVSVAEQIKDVEKIEFDSVEDMVRAGWVGD